MGVVAYKVFGPPDTTVVNEFECGQFDLLQEYQPGNGWTEISRNCDNMPIDRRTLRPYASGWNNSGYANPAIPSRLPFEKAFIAAEDEILLTFDFSDINGGFLPSGLIGFSLYQNGKYIPSRALTADYGTSIVTLSSEWGVPGANYDGVYWVQPYTP